MGTSLLLPGLPASPGRRTGTCPAAAAGALRAETRGPYRVGLLAFRWQWASRTDSTEGLPCHVAETDEAGRDWVKAARTRMTTTSTNATMTEEAGGRASAAGAAAHAAEVARQERFPFGENWQRFLRVLDDDRIRRAEDALKRMLQVDDLRGRRFLDIGSGSGLSSLAARRLGAQVHSFDYDPQSVACTAELRRRYFRDDPEWSVEQGSVLDAAYLRSLGSFDVVYSWGVLHHTGRMWQALEHAARAVAPGGRLFIAIYNDTGSQSRRWAWVKRTYNRLPRPARLPFTLLVAAPGEIKRFARAVLTGDLAAYRRSWTACNDRGMNRWHDLVDWVGGYPYEVARPEELFEFYRDRGYTLVAMKCGGVGLGCNEFVFEHTTPRRHGVDEGAGRPRVAS
jgi:2-polyprenyl-3-methyl-5-hydroxy-6-metoxy-1,4-benzoquinol methylase